MAEGKQRESYRVNGEELLKKVKELLHEGNIRKITITDKSDKVIAEFPLTLGVAGLILAPALAAIGTIAALVGECTIMVEK